MAGKCHAPSHPGEIQRYFRDMLLKNF